MGVPVDSQITIANVKILSAAAQMGVEFRIEDLRRPRL